MTKSLSPSSVSLSSSSSVTKKKKKKKKSKDIIRGRITSYASTIVNVPPDIVWKTITDIDSNPINISSVTSVERIDGSAKGDEAVVGTRWREERLCGGSLFVQTKTVTVIGCRECHDHNEDDDDEDDDDDDHDDDDKDDKDDDDDDEEEGEEGGGEGKGKGKGKGKGEENDGGDRDEEGSGISVDAKEGHFETKEQREMEGARTEESPELRSCRRVQCSPPSRNARIQNDDARGADAGAGIGIGMGTVARRRQRSDGGSRISHGHRQASWPKSFSLIISYDAPFDKAVNTSTLTVQPYEPTPAADDGHDGRNKNRLHPTSMRLGSKPQTLLSGTFAVAPGRFIDRMYFAIGSLCCCCGFSSKNTTASFQKEIDDLAAAAVMTAAKEADTATAATGKVEPVTTPRCARWA